MFMIMRSEGDKIRYVTTPSRDKKYAIVAFSRFLADMLQIVPDDVLSIVVRSIVDLCTEAPTSGFQIASTLPQPDTEDLLVDGAIDQTFAFQRSQFIQLNAAKIELTDKLEQEIPCAKQYFVQTLEQVIAPSKGVPA